MSEREPRARRATTDAPGAAGRRGHGVPGKSTLTQRLPPRRREAQPDVEPRVAGGGAERTGRDGAAAASGLADRRGDAEEAPRPGQAEAGSYDALPESLRSWMPDTERVLAELDELIARASWEQMRSDVVAVPDAGSRWRAQQRMGGRMPELEGVGSIASIHEVVAGIRALQPGWPRMPTPERLEQVLAVVNRALVGADVPPAKAVELSSRRSMASFNFKSWSLLVSSRLVSKGAPTAHEGNAETHASETNAGRLSDADAAELADTAAHEARHGEQWFLAARYAAAKGSDAAAIQAAQEIAPEIAAMAAARPLAGVSAVTARLAATMYDATIENKEDNQRKGDDYGYDEMERQRGIAFAAREALRAAPSAEALKTAQAALEALRSAMDAVIEKYVTYRGIPYESDAHDVGAEAAVAFGAAR